MGAGTNARGVGILFRNGFDCKISKKIVDPLGRYLGLEAKINDEKYFLLIYTLQTRIVSWLSFMTI